MFSTTRRGAPWKRSSPALTVRPNPVPVTNQEPTSFELSWSGLVPNSRYLGYLDYEGALSPTVVKIRS